MTAWKRLCRWFSWCEDDGLNRYGQWFLDCRLWELSWRQASKTVITGGLLFSKQLIGLFSWRVCLITFGAGEQFCNKVYAYILAGRSVGSSIIWTFTVSPVGPSPYYFILFSLNWVGSQKCCTKSFKICAFVAFCGGSITIEFQQIVYGGHGDDILCAGLSSDISHEWTAGKSGSESNLWVR